MVGVFGGKPEKPPLLEGDRSVINRDGQLLLAMSPSVSVLSQHLSFSPPIRRPVLTSWRGSECGEKTKAVFQLGCKNGLRAGSRARFAKG